MPRLPGYFVVLAPFCYKLSILISNPERRELHHGQHHGVAGAGVEEAEVGAHGVRGKQDPDADAAAAAAFEDPPAAGPLPVGLCRGRRDIAPFVGGGSERPVPVREVIRLID